MLLPLTNQFSTRITLKGVNYRKKMAKKEIVVDQKTLTQMRKKYITYFKHKRPIKNETKTKKVYTKTIFYIATLKSTPRKYFMKSRV